MRPAGRVFETPVLVEASHNQVFEVDALEVENFTNLGKLNLVAVHYF